ncbi:hypothetical protein QKT26_gp74 [Carcinus maenas nudivirus]|uniref:Uncharacterized protein n=1 Tax=Carcinus maenas nudivirus TaxID=2880837 RepID=A0AAE9BYX0_9VIRU|nr:hypothetical protein QKT26_gp74 [Carcinus maenas nudivirus]UBZ25664.1 hypothetical protein CmNV_073 [Carcinus maenas nudivirus]
MLMISTLLNDYKKHIDEALMQLSNSKSSIIEFQSIIFNIITQLKEMGNQARQKLQLETSVSIENENKKEEYVKELGNYLARKNQLEQSDDEDALNENQRELDIVIENVERVSKIINDIENHPFQTKYIPKYSALERFLKTSFKNMENIRKSLEEDRNMLTADSAEIREGLIKLSQNIMSKILKDNTDISVVNTTISSIQSKLDTINLKINKYNILIDSFNNMSESLKMMQLSYVDSNKRRRRIYFININDYISTLEKHSTYKMDYDPIKKMIDEFFMKTQLQIPVSIINIEAPDLTFKKELYSTEVMDYETTAGFDFNADTFKPPEPDDMGGADLPDNINDDRYTIKLTNADWNNGDISFNLLIRYIEVCSRVGGIKTKVNNMQKTTDFTVNMYIGEFNFVLYKAGMNDLYIYNLQNTEQKLPKYMLDIIQTFKNVYSYSYLGSFDYVRVAGLMSLFVVNQYDPTHWKKSLKTKELMKNTIRTNSIETLMSKTDVMDEDIVFDSIKSTFKTKKRKYN